MALPEFDRLTDSDFERLAEFIHDYSGIKMPFGKKSMVEGRLRKRVRAVGAKSLSDYCEYLFNGDGLESETIGLIDAVSTNKTDFFREPDHFRYLVEHAVPELVANGAVSRSTPFRIWSAAASTGAEAYTLAMVMSDLPQLPVGVKSQIVATDICTEVLRTALAGIYPRSMAAPIPAEYRRRYVMEGKGAMAGKVRVVPELRSMVSFGRLNLMEHPYPIESEFHVIFCRNILIYFDRPTQAAVLTELCEHLKPGGYLFLGHSETMAGFGLPLRPAATTIFQRVPGR